MPWLLSAGLETHRIKLSFSLNRLVLEANTPDPGNASDGVQIDKSHGDANSTTSGR